VTGLFFSQMTVSFGGMVDFEFPRAPADLTTIAASLAVSAANVEPFKRVDVLLIFGRLRASLFLSLFGEIPPCLEDPGTNRIWPLRFANELVFSQKNALILYMVE